MKLKRSLLPEFDLTGMPLFVDTRLHRSFGGGGGGKTESSTIAEPWQGAQAGMRDAAAQAQAMYGAGNFDVMYPSKNPIADLSQTTQQGLNTYLNNPNNLDGKVTTAASGALDTFSGNMQRGGQMSDVFNPVATSGANYAQQVIDRGMNTTAEQDLQQGLDTASGRLTNYLQPTANMSNEDTLRQLQQGYKDPAFQAYVDSTNQDIINQIKQQGVLPSQIRAMSEGAYGGSGTDNANRRFATDMLRQTGQNTNQLILAQQDKQLAASGLIQQAQQGAGAFDQGEYGLGLQTGNLASQLEAQDIQQALAAGNFGLSGAQLGSDISNKAATGAGMFGPTLGEVPYAQANRDLKVGSVMDQRSQAARDAEIARDLFNQQVDDKALQNYANIMTQLGGAGGSQITTQEGGGTSSVAGALGGAAGAAGIIGATGVGMTGTAAAGTLAMGPVGWGILAGGALLGSGILG